MQRIHQVLSALLPVLAFIVIVKGAYVRLSDAGLGCPDWPGCYGQLVVPATAEEVGDVAHLDARPLEPGKAWREMIHRYLASSLGTGILLLALLAWRQRARCSPVIPFLLVPLVILQGLLGMWTVTWLLKPLVVVAHLLGGFTVLALLWWHWLDTRDAPRARASSSLRPFAAVALAVLAVQVFLGGWTSANYAALACTDFPRCHGAWWPQTDFENAFVLWRGLGVNYEFGVLDTPARTAIHLAHRAGALCVTGVILGLVVAAWRRADARGRRIAWCILALLAVQVLLGITNVLRGLPLPVAVMHNGTAALLLLGLVTLFRHVSPAQPTLGRT
ncbi:MAG: heme A synthase [Gammaproteobacteria bacterium]